MFASRLNVGESLLRQGMDASEFEARAEELDRLEDLWRLMVGFARECRVMRLGYHHLPPPGSPDAQLVRIENEGFGEALLAQYLAARVNGFAVLAAAIQNSVRPVYLDELESSGRLNARERAHIAGYRAAGA